MIWVDRVVKDLKKRKKKLEWVDDMKTPSGRIHVGALRGVVVHDLIFKALAQADVNAEFSWVFEDHDPMDAIPSYLDCKKWEKYLGIQLYKIPAPEHGFSNFAEYHAKEFQQVFEQINCHPKIIWGSKLYNSGKMNCGIKKILDNTATVRDIYAQITKRKLPSDWHPFNPVCQECGKIGTTYVYEWDGKYVHYACKQDLVTWAKGCGHEGKVSPYDGTGKIPWKVEWAVKWSVIGITVEGAGKDHMSKGGSHDIASAICREILKYPVPYSFAYEWLTIGGRKMSSSKGVGTSAKEVAQILSPDLLRFFIVRTPMTSALDFNPEGDTIPDLFDEYDRCMSAYFDKLEVKIPKGKKGEVLLDLARIIELSQVRQLPESRLFLPRFRTVASLIKANTDVLNFFEEQKRKSLTLEEKEILEERVAYAKVYLKDYAAAGDKTEFLKELPSGLSLSDDHKKFLTALAHKLKSASSDREALQTLIFDILKKGDFSPKDVFPAFYQVLIGRDSGPRAADIILEFGIEKVRERLRESTEGRVLETAKKEKQLYPLLKDRNIFSIDRHVSAKFPSITVGIAIIKGVKIENTDRELRGKIDVFMQNQAGLTTQTLGKYFEIQSYRKIYKETGIDWHSRRPSPEGLLRRVALGKGLYTINACVDAYNLVVMKHRVSVGAFNFNKIQFPTVLRFAKDGEEILLLGDDKPTRYREGEIAYFDQEGGYNIDFNFRDAQRTAVTDRTKNLLINVEGVFDITRSQVEKTLQETIKLIKKYCGGEIKTAGIVIAS